ncbi:MAG: N-methyl-L-tryptophan oxidase [Deltaproteobacteria bacterium]|nr:N-methyl-L-tryptophan oxidase [Deltaproteobacteria bacterium]
MESVDVVVVGLGVMGAAALQRLAARGLRVVGLERFDVPHAQGSSHGGTRVIRKAYYEDPRYVPHLHASWDAWRGLERELDTTLLVQTGGLHFGPPDHPEMMGVRKSVAAFDLAHEVLDARAIHARFPMFQPDEGDEGLLEVEAGVLFAERCVAALAESALRHGALVRARERVTAIELGGPEVVVVTERGSWSAPRVVLALGPWWPAAAPLPAPAPMKVERQVQLWFAPRVIGDITSLGPARMPVFLRFGDDLFYGMPLVREAGPLGVKVCGHHGGDAAHPETLDRALRPEDEARVRGFLQRHMPSVDGPLLGARVCMYTNTPDHHFVVGAHPADPRVVVAAGFSGHGFKLAPAIGELVLRAVQGERAPEPLFDPARFAAPA